MVIRDTTPEAQAVLTGIYRQMTPDQKLQRVYELTRLTRELAKSRIREANPGWDEPRIHQRLVEELYGVRVPA